MHPENDDTYPEDVRESPARRELYDHFNQDGQLTVQIDNTIREAVRPYWIGNRQKRREIWLAICETLISNGYTDDDAEAEADRLMEIVQRQEEYDG